MNLVCIAPMMDWTDKHCRYFHRLLTRKTLLYTEMVTTGALVHGDVQRHLRFNAEEHPLALQLGGSDTAELAHCAKLGEQWGYDEINLNCGCPSERVQRGSFGACLMAEPGLVADCVKAMVDAVSVPVTVKHRIGIDKTESYDFVRDFVGQVSEAGCKVFIVHARNAWLKGLSPKQNREVPPLRYEVVHRLKREFPRLGIVVNGGITTSVQVLEQLQSVDGVMLGREAYHNPWWLAGWDQAFCGAAHQPVHPEPVEGFTRVSTSSPRTEMGSPRTEMGSPRTEMGSIRTDMGSTRTDLDISRESVEAQMCDYMVRERQQHATGWNSIARHMLGLRNGLPGARRWRQVWSDHSLRDWAPHAVMEKARAASSHFAIEDRTVHV